jgi:hypothetical protein
MSAPAWFSVGIGHREINPIISAMGPYPVGQLSLKSGHQ